MIASASRALAPVLGALALVVATACGPGDDRPPRAHPAGDGAAEVAPPGAAGDTSAELSRPRRAPEVAGGGPEMVGGAVGEPAAEADPGSSDTLPAERRPPPPPVELPDDTDRPAFLRPDRIRGIYLNAWTAGSARRIEELLELARGTEVNAFVIDLKDASGYVSHATGVATAREVGAAGEIRIHDLPGLLRRLEEEGVYPIARIVIVKDPLLADARPGWAVQDSAGGVWEDSRGIRWLNLFDERVQAYHLELAHEAVALGFPEIQWDYVRFPDASPADMARARFPGADGRSRSAAVRGFLERSREELDPLGVEVTADVFGVTTTGDDVGIGQVWEDFIDVVDVALPMVYPSHYWRGSFGIEEPNAHPYEVVRLALERAVERSREVEGAGAVRPWLQDFTLGEPPYGAPEVRAQIEATYDAGIGEWILWNPSSRYTRGALRPVDGWDAEPLLRVGGMLVPVSQRETALELARSLRREPAKGTAGPAGDTASEAEGGGR